MFGEEKIFFKEHLSVNTYVEKNEKRYKSWMIPFKDEITEKYKNDYLSLFDRYNKAAKVLKDKYEERIDVLKSLSSNDENIIDRVIISIMTILNESNRINEKTAELENKFFSAVMEDETILLTTEEYSKYDYMNNVSDIQMVSQLSKEDQDKITLRHTVMFYGSVDKLIRRPSPASDCEITGVCICGTNCVADGTEIKITREKYNEEQEKINDSMSKLFANIGFSSLGY